jgi:hypothetical protein
LLRASIATRAPNCANRTAVASPSPLLSPVTIASRRVKSGHPTPPVAIRRPTPHPNATRTAPFYRWRHGPCRPAMPARTGRQSRTAHRPRAYGPRPRGNSGLSPDSGSTSANGSCHRLLRRELPMTTLDLEDYWTSGKHEGLNCPMRTSGVECLVDRTTAHRRTPETQNANRKPR